MGDDMKLKFELGLRELINMCLDGGMHPSEMTEALEKEVKWSRHPWTGKPTAVKDPPAEH
jgi:hypothetical protein